MASSGPDRVRIGVLAASMAAIVGYGAHPGGSRLAAAGIAPRGDGPWRAASTYDSINIRTMPPSDGSMRLFAFDERMNRFPHPAPQDDLASCIPYPPAPPPAGLRPMCAERRRDAEHAVRPREGKKTINLIRWLPGERGFAFTSTPMDEGKAADIS